MLGGLLSHHGWPARSSCELGLARRPPSSPHGSLAEACRDGGPGLVLLSQNKMPPSQTSSVVCPHPATKTHRLGSRACWPLPQGTSSEAVAVQDVRETDPAGHCEGLLAQVRASWTQHCPRGGRGDFPSHSWASAPAWGPTVTRCHLLTKTRGLPKVWRTCTSPATYGLQFFCTRQTRFYSIFPQTFSSPHVCSEKWVIVWRGPHVDVAVCTHTHPDGRPRPHPGPWHNRMKSYHGA